MEGGGRFLRRNQAKADLLYGFLDGSRFFSNPIAPEARSLMNVPFRLPDARLGLAAQARS